MLSMYIFLCAALLRPAGAVDDLAPMSPDETVMKALKLSTDYNKAARPPPDWGTSNTVNVFVYLNTLIRLDSANQELKLKVWLQLYWIDSRLAWQGRFNRSLDNISAIGMPASNLWQPDASFYDVVEMTDQQEDKAIFSVWNSGQVLKSIGITLTTKCGLQMQHFPFDEQDCAVRISSVQQTIGATRLQIKSIWENDSPEKFILKSSEFCIRWARLENGTFGFYNTVVLRIGFRRIPTFYVVNLMLPSVLLTALSAVAFLLPHDCGERISFSITIVLSMCVFLQLAGNYTPTQSESVPLITWFFSVAVLLTMLNVLCNAFVLRCHIKQASGAHVSNRIIRALFLNRYVLAGSQWKISDASCSASGPFPVSSSAGLNRSEWSVVGASSDKVFFVVFTISGLIMLAVPAAIHIMTLNWNCLGM